MTTIPLTYHRSEREQLHLQRSLVTRRLYSLSVCGNRLHYSHIYCSSRVIDELRKRFANFLDTGGKATSDTIKAGFKIITSDPRVKVVFVNIFGGLTLGDMIANGILLAFKDLGLTVPVVVRIRGTREAEGQKIIRDSGLKMDAYGKSHRRSRFQS